MLDDINVLIFEATSRCNAACPLCARTAGASYLTTPGLELNEINPALLDKVLDDPVLANISFIHINGNYGDIVMHSNPKELLSVILNRGITMGINTNGGALSKDFWAWAGEHRLRIEFGIDGLEDTHHLYRRNTRFSTVIENAKTFINAGGLASWAFSIFKHNEHQIDEAESLAKELGFKRFKARPSRTPGNNLMKLSVVDRSLNHEYWLEHSEKYHPYVSDTNKTYNLKKNPEWLNEQIKLNSRNTSRYSTTSCIQCKIQKDKSIFIDFNSNVWPCCWIAQHAERDLDYPLLRKVLDEGNLNLRNHSLSDIVSSGIFNQIEETWNTDKPLYTCYQICKEKSATDFRYAGTDVKRINDI